MLANIQNQKRLRLVINFEDFLSVLDNTDTQYLDMREGCDSYANKIRCPKAWLVSLIVQQESKSQVAYHTRYSAAFYSCITTVRTIILSLPYVDCAFISENHGVEGSPP